MAKVVMLNAKKMNYDGKLDLSAFGSELVVYEDSTTEQIVERSEGASVIITKELPVPASVIEQLPDSVVAICEAGTGYNNIDLAAATKKGITVCNIPAYSSQRVAQTAIMLILNLSSEMGKQIRMLERKDHSNFEKYLQCSHVEINGATLGMIGAGNIGREVIKVAKALGMIILIYTRTPRENEDGIVYTTLEEVLKNSDYLSLHCPLTEQTRHIINKDTLSLMKPSACIINTSRGALIDEPALIEALKNGVIAGAGLDVQETEPPIADNPLYDMENVILTPHMGWKGLQTRQRLMDMLAENVKMVLAGTPINKVN